MLYLTVLDPPPDDGPGPMNNEDVNRLITALKNSEADKAARIARQLAEQRTPIQFSLDMINETGNVAPPPPPQPVVKPLRYLQ